jgi:hypothetical protein
MASKFPHNPRENHGRQYIIFVVCKGNLIGLSDGFVGLRAEGSSVYDSNTLYSIKEVRLRESTVCGTVLVEEVLVMVVIGEA